MHNRSEKEDWDTSDETAFLARGYTLLAALAQDQVRDLDEPNGTLRSAGQQITGNINIFSACITSLMNSFGHRTVGAHTGQLDQHR